MNLNFSPKIFTCLRLRIKLTSRSDVIIKYISNYIKKSTGLGLYMLPFNNNSYIETVND